MFSLKSGCVLFHFLLGRLGWFRKSDLAQSVLSCRKPVHQWEAASPAPSSLSVRKGLFEKRLPSKTVKDTTKLLSCIWGEEMNRNFSLKPHVAKRVGSRSQPSLFASIDWFLLKQSTQSTDTEVHLSCDPGGSPPYSTVSTAFSPSAVTLWYPASRHQIAATETISPAGRMLLSPAL